VGRISFFTFVLIANSAFADCGNLCTWHWWTQATSETLQAEIASGADINGRNFHDGDTPLHEASMYGNAQLIEQLVEAGAELNTYNATDFTPILSAARYGPSANRHERLGALIRSGANLTIEANDGSNPLHLVVETGDFDYIPSHLSVKLLIESGLNLNKQNNLGLTPLHLSAKFSSPAHVQFLLDKGADPLVRDKYGNSALHYASEGKFTENLETLIKSGAAIDAPNNEGMTALHMAASLNRLDNARTLIKLGAKATAKDKNGRTPMFFSLESASVKQNSFLMNAGSYSPANRIELLQLLIDAGSDVNLKANNGNRPLHIAAEFGLPNDIEFLLSKNADTLVLNNKNETPFDVAQHNSILRSSKMYWELKPN
jgi:ankyrin repeat protein